MSKRLVLLLLSLTLFAGCGFKLRGNFDMSPELETLSIQGGERELVDQLSTILVKSGSTIVDAQSEAPSLLIEISEFEREVRTTDADGIATGFKYQYNVEYLVIDAAGEELQPRAIISQIRSLDYEPGNELEVEEEEEFLREEMEKEIVLQIMRRLSRI